MSVRYILLYAVLICAFLLMISEQSTCQNTNCTLSGYISSVKSEIDSLSCMQTKLELVLKVLNESTVQYKTRSKQLEKISSALLLLKGERDVLEKSQIVNTIPEITKSIVDSPQGKRFSDGTRAVSCLGYRNTTRGNLTDGVYEIELENKTLTVFCDMNTAGGGWTLFASIARDYSGPLFRVFDQTNAGPSSSSSTFHIISKELLERSNYIMAAGDDDNNVITNFYTSNWPHSSYCNITTAFRNKIKNPTTFADLQTTCVRVKGAPTLPTHFNYGTTDNNHSIGFRMGIPSPGFVGHMGASGWGTYSYLTGLSTNEPSIGNYPGLAYNFGTASASGTANRNGALFLK